MALIFRELIKPPHECLPSRYDPINYISRCGICYRAMPDDELDFEIDAKIKRETQRSAGMRIIDRVLERREREEAKKRAV